MKKVQEKKEWISDEMVKKCKSDIAKFGFDGQHYIKFLISVRAMKDETTVLKFSNHEINEYREMFLRKNEMDLENDPFALDRSKIFTSGENGNKYETGYFCPRSFWDKISATRI